MKNSAPFIHLSFPLTKKCNAKCIFCDAWQNKDSDSIASSFWLKTAKNFKDFTQIKSISLDGGEPFLYEEIFDLARGLRKMGISPSVTTSGSLLDSDCCKKTKNTGQPDTCSLVVDYLCGDDTHADQ